MWGVGGSPAAAQIFCPDKTLQEQSEQLSGDFKTPIRLNQNELDFMETVFS